MMFDPTSLKLANALPEDELISAHEEQAVTEAKQSRRQSKPCLREDVLADFGLTMADFQKVA